MSAGVFSARVRGLVWERDGGCCVRCGREAENVHHRSPRGAGGSKAVWVSAPSNGLALCGSGTTGCHAHVETNRVEAVQYGWIVPRNRVARPVDVPVWYASEREWFMLTDDGGRVRVDSPVPF